MHCLVWQVEVWDGVLLFKTRLNVQILSHKIQQPLQWWSVVVYAAIPGGKYRLCWITLACVRCDIYECWESRKRPGCETAENHCRHAKPNNNTDIYFLSSALPLSECLLSSIPLIFIFPHGGSTTPHLMGSDNPLMPPTQRLTSFLFSFPPLDLLSILFWNLLFFSLLWGATMSQAPLLYQFHQKANQQSRSGAVLRTVILSVTNRQSSKSKQVLQ